MPWPHSPTFTTARLTSFDAQLGKLVPATNAEWDTLLGSLGDSSGSPRSIYLMADASTQASDVNNVHNLPPTTPGLPYVSYQNPIPGCSGVGIGINNAAVDIGFVKQHGTLPNPATTSYAVLAYVYLRSAPSGADQGFLSVSDAAIYAGIKQNTLLPMLGSGGPEATRGSVPLPIGQLFPVILKHDIARSAIKFYTPYEILQMGYSSSSSNTGEVDFGVALASGLYAANAFYRYGALFLGAAAERSDAQWASILVGLGWAPTWGIAPVVDAASQKYLPSTVQGWEALNEVPPSSCWPCTESYGVVLADTIGDCYLSAQANTAVAASVSGWRRTGLSVTGNLNAVYAGSTDSRLGNPASKSLLALAYVYIATGYGSASFWSWVFGFDALQFAAVSVTTGGKIGCYQNGGFAAGGSLDHRGTVRPILFMLDITNQKSTIWTDLETISGPTFAADNNGAGFFLGNHAGAVPSAACTVLGAALWVGASAEIATNQARALLNRLGWTTLW
jgi:hypothetical protein